MGDNAMERFGYLDGGDGYVKKTGSDVASVKHADRFIKAQRSAEDATSLVYRGQSNVRSLSLIHILDLSHLSIMKYYDKASPKLFKAMVSGTHIKTGTLSAMKAGGGSKPFLKLDFEEDVYKRQARRRCRFGFDPCRGPG